MCGLFFGALGLGNLSDAIGRKNTMLVSVVGSVIVNTGLIFINDPYAFTFVRLLVEVLTNPKNYFRSTYTILKRVGDHYRSFFELVDLEFHFPGLHPITAGAFAHGGVVVGYVWIMEFVGPNSRSWVGAHYLSLFSIGFAFLSLVGYFARDWHDMQIWESLQLFF